MLKNSIRGRLSPSLAQQHQCRVQISRSQASCRPLRQTPVMCSTEKEDLIQYAPQRIIEARKLPNQAETIFNSGESVETLLSRVPVLAQSPTQRSVSDLDYLSVSPSSHVTPPVAEHRKCSFVHVSWQYFVAPHHQPFPIHTHQNRNCWPSSRVMAPRSLGEFKHRSQCEDEGVGVS